MERRARHRLTKPLHLLSFWEGGVDACARMCCVCGVNDRLSSVCLCVCGCVCVPGKFLVHFLCLCVHCGAKWGGNMARLRERCVYVSRSINLAKQVGFAGRTSEM